VRYTKDLGNMNVVLNGQRIFNHPMRPLVTASAQVTVGENRINRNASCPRFTGRIR
jgi:hypothetical protein